MIRMLALSLFLCAFAPAMAQEKAEPAPATAEAPATAAPEATMAAAQAPASAPAPAKVWRTERVLLQTEAGPITLELESERAPITTANFLNYVAKKRFDGATFYRALRFPERDELGLIQGGTKGDPKRVLPPIAHEPTTKTGLTHDDGAISMARAAPGTAQGDFFIILGGLPGLDANPEGEGDNQGYAVFGHVVAGMDVVRAILEAPVSATAGEGSMKGQMLEHPIRILSATRVAP